MGPLELKLQTFVSLPEWALGTELESSEEQQMFLSAELFFQLFSMAENGFPFLKGGPLARGLTCSPAGLFSTLASAIILLVFPLCAFAASVAEESDGRMEIVKSSHGCENGAGSANWVGSGGTAGLGLDL